MRDDLLILRPDAKTEASQLLLLFHGVGSSAEDLRPLGQALAALRPNDFIVSVRSPDTGDFGQGWQWFSVQGVTESNRPQRGAAAMPRFVDAVRELGGKATLDLFPGLGHGIDARVVARVAGYLQAVAP